MSSDITAQITCPHCNKTYRFTWIPEGAMGKKTGVDRSHQTRTSKEFAENSRELKHKPDEQAAALRKQLVDLKDQYTTGHIKRRFVQPSRINIARLVRSAGIIGRMGRTGCVYTPLAWLNGKSVSLSKDPQR